MASSSSSHQKNQELISFSGIQSAGERKLDSESSYNEKNQELISFSGIQSAGKRRPVSESSTLYDVFINHRGPDVKGTLATQFYNSLKELGIHAFLDSQEKELGKSFPSTIKTAIRSAKVHIAIFSKRYAESAWCLDELILMLESKVKIIPVFYQVKPRDLRHIEKGEYAKAFINHKEKDRYDEKQLNVWKEALKDLSLIAGEEFYSECDYQKIVAAVQKEVQRKTCLHVAEYPVGLDNLVEDFERRCLDQLVQDLEDKCRLEEGKHQAKVVGIYGLGGSGKTTLGKELFNRKKSNYTTATFLSDVREASERGKLPLLQSKLIEDLFGRKISFINEDQGTCSLKDHLSRAKILSSLIVVDDIYHVDQLNALLVTYFLKIPGNSLVIVTTRDVGVLTAAGITVVYHLGGMDRNDAKELFCFHAFGKRDPCSRYEVHVNHFVDVCGGLPLSLKVLGRHVRGRDHEFWKSELIKVRKALPKDIKQILKISFDALDREEQEVFMDIACFFVGKQASRAERILEGSGWNVYNAMERLKDKCLVEKGELPSQDDMGPVLIMHDHLRVLGREMALDRSPPDRLWRPEDLRPLESMGFKTILAKTDIRCFHSFFDKTMGSLVKFFVGQPDSRFETSASLLWLQLEGISKEKRNFPTWIPLKNLQCLKINCSGLETLWENDTQAPSQLKELQICHSFGGNRWSNTSECSALKELRLERLRSLEKICIQNCYSLKSVSGISNQSSLVELEIINCRNLYFENLCLSGMKCLERINFVGKVSVKYFRSDGCPKLNKIKGLNCNGLVELSICNCPELEELSVYGNPYLEKIIVDGCGKLNTIKGSPCNSLAELSIRDCPELMQLPDFISSSCFEKTIIDGCGKLKYFKLHDCQNLKNVSGKCPELEGLTSSVILSGLEHLDIYCCHKLQNITLPTTLISLSVVSCEHLQRVAGIGELTKPIIEECPELQELPSLVSLGCLEEIDISFCHKLQNITLPATLISLSLRSCKALQRVAGIGDLPKLMKLIIKECPELEELPSLVRLSCLKEIDIGSCGKLQNILPPSTLNSLSVQSCRGFQRIAGISDLQKLTKLIIKECPDLRSYQVLSD